ncbi:macrophage mannose receptor 1-like [Micropterus dolomieu]|uniref:macrophage mannose receptor 1-like n=1 Tax=Micropterus dolomieu TaxID=147949 RepID=UPI001E8E2D57|nr:macrophage mannose receptor 1-like [Micropterus dolomieu]
MCFMCMCVSTGLCAVSSHVQRQYHFVYELKNMTEARSYCREKYTDLATVDDMEDVETLNEMADLSKMKYKEYSHRAWIGLYDDLHSWRWSLSDRRFYKDGETEFRQWAPKEPNNQDSGELCAQMYDTGRWNDYKCTNPLKAVCIDVRGPTATFVLSDNSMTWTEAQSYCREHFTDLASVRNMAENQKVKELVPAGGKVWIGLFRDSWKWSDGSNSSFRLWNQRTKEPNNNFKKEACVAAAFNYSGKWEDFNCDFKRASICYSVVRASKQVMKVRLKKKSSSVDLNDPAVMEDVLKQLQERLKDQGVNEDVKLSWKKQSDGKVFHED